MWRLRRDRGFLPSDYRERCGCMAVRQAGASARAASLRMFVAGAKQREARGNDLLHRIDDGGQEFVGDDLVRMAGKSGFQTAAPGNPQFRIDVDNRDASTD